MKDLRFFLPFFLLLMLILILTGCKGVVPSPGVTEDDTVVSGQILMPYCCLLSQEMAESASRDKYSGYNCYDETDIWRPAPEAVVELRAYDNCKVKYSTETDETGNYEFTDVKPGLYILTAYCPTDEEYYLKDVIEKASGEALDAGIPDCDSTSLALVIEYIGDTYCHCQVVCPCFSEQWSQEFKLVKKIAESPSVNMEVNIPAIIAHEDFGTLCNVDGQGNLVEDDLVDMICSKLQSCCTSPGQTGDDDDDDDDDDDPCEGNTAPYNIALDNLTATVGQPYSGTVTAEDDDGDTLTFVFTAGFTPPGNMAINSETGVITWTPTAEDICVCQQEKWIQFRTRSFAPTICPPVSVTVSDPCYSVDATFCIEVQAAPNPEIEVTKTATESSYDEVNDVIHYTITVENTGNVSITNLSVTDPQATTGPTYDSGDTGNDGILGVDEIWTYLATHTITQADLDAGSFTNTATATGKDPQNQDVTDNDDETVDAIFYTVTYDANGGTGAPTDPSSPYFAGVTVTVVSGVPTRTNYTFNGWLYNATNYTNGDTFTMPAENVILVAQWLPNLFDLGTATIAFEDLPIGGGTVPGGGFMNNDYDYNDWVVELDIDTEFDGDTPNLSSITFDIIPEARGSGYDHEFHIMIPAGTFSEDGTFDLVISGDSGSSSGTFNASSDMDFEVIPDTRYSLNDDPGYQTNTIESSHITPTVTATLTITFDTPFYHDFSNYDPYSSDSMHGQGLFFDPYLFVVYNNEEINKGDVRMLTVPDDWKWPEEQVHIGDVYSGVTTGSPPDFSPDWWDGPYNNCVYGDGISCP